MKVFWGTNWGCRENAGAFLDDTTLIYTICGETFITRWHPATTRWDTAVSWPYIFPNSTWDGLRYYTGGTGIAVTPGRKKVYMAGGRASSDLIVTYRNPRDTSMDGKLGKIYRLNISVLSDSLYFAGVDSGRFKAFPSITADGKTLFFDANYQGDYTIYVSHLLIDANGDSVSEAVRQSPPGSGSIPPIPIRLTRPPRCATTCRGGVGYGSRSGIYWAGGYARWPKGYRKAGSTTCR